MKPFVMIASAILLVGGVTYVLSNKQTPQTVENAFAATSNLVKNVKSGGGVTWVLSYFALWLLLVIMTDLGAGDLAAVLAGVIFVSVLFSQLQNGNLQHNLANLGISGV